MNNQTIPWPQVETAILRLRQFINPEQMRLLISLARSGEERDFFRQKLIDQAALISAMPQTYDQDGLGDQAVIWLHYFTGGADWWITEKDKESEQLQAFGLADLFHDGGELGYISIVELLEVGAEIDLYWTAKTLGELRPDKSRSKVLAEHQQHHERCLADAQAEQVPKATEATAATIEFDEAKALSLLLNPKQ